MTLFSLSVNSVMLNSLIQQFSEQNNSMHNNKSGTTTTKNKKQTNKSRITSLRLDAQTCSISFYVHSL